MKLPIETWISDRFTSKNVLDLFQESVVCYKNGAYRASLLLSYLGFLTIIRYTLLNSKPASNYSAIEWETNVRSAVSNQESWEQGVTNIILINPAASRAKPVFRLSDDLRDQVEYWRKRRNDAAHNKDNQIDNSHTESFWSFVISNVPKLAVDGGMLGLINKFKDHFDDLKTAPGSDVKPLVSEIPSSILESELPQFFEQLMNAIDDEIWGFNDKIGAVFNKIFTLNSTTISDAVATFLKAKGHDLDFLDKFPGRLLFMKYELAELRTLWKKRILSKNPLNRFNILASLLRNNSIPDSELEGVYQSLFNLFDQRLRSFLPNNEEDRRVLQQNGYYDYIHKRAITEMNLKWVKDVNSKCSLIADYIVNSPLLPDTVEAVCTLGNGAYASNWLIDELERDFTANPKLKGRFNDMAQKSGLHVPSQLST